MKAVFWVLAAFGLSGGSPAMAGDLFTYDVPRALQYSNHNDDYTVQARLPGGEWKDLYEWNVRVDLDRPQDASMVYFDFTGTVELRIQKNNGTFSKVSIGPRSGAPQTDCARGKGLSDARQAAEHRGLL